MSKKLDLYDLGRAKAEVEATVFQEIYNEADKDAVKEDVEKYVNVYRGLSQRDKRIVRARFKDDLIGMLESLTDIGLAECFD